MIEKVIHIFWSFNIGGAETMLVDIINHQIKQGVNVYLIVINKNYSKELLDTLDKQVNLKLINRPVGSINPLYFFELNKFLFRHSESIVHCHNYSLAKIILKPFLKRSVLTVHGFNRPIKRNNNYSMVVAISKAIRNDLEEKGIQNCELIYNGVNSNLINKKNGFNSSIKIVCIGRLEHQIKGQDLLINAFSILKKSSNNITLHFIGEGVSEFELKKMVLETNLSNDVFFHPPMTRAKIYQELNNFDILVQPSIHEGFGLTVIEGMIAKIPIIISPALGLVEVTNNGKFAYQVKKNTANELSYTLERVISDLRLNLEELTKKLENAESFAIQNFSIVNTSTKYLQLYNKVLSNTHKG